jgi:PadR family transcriptional regulator PadR
MARSRTLSAPARDVLAILAEAGARWCHGYELCRQAGIQSGTLYPLLIRLEAQGHLEAEWQQPAEAGRPPRHAYRLTAAGRRLVIQNPPLAAPRAAGVAGRAA